MNDFLDILCKIVYASIGLVVMAVCIGFVLIVFCDFLQSHKKNELRDLILLLSRLHINYEYISNNSLTFTTEYGTEVVVIWDEKTKKIEVIR